MAGPENTTESRRRSLTGVPVRSVLRPIQARAELARKLRVVAIARVILVSLSLLLLVLMTQVAPPQSVPEIESWQYALVVVTYAVSLAYFWLVRYSAILNLLAYVQFVLDSLVVSILVAFTGGIVSVFSFAYVFVILAASTTLYRRGAILAAVFCLLAFGTVVSLQVEQMWRVLPHVSAASAAVSFFVTSLGISMVAYLGSTLTERLRKTDAVLAEKASDLRQLEELHAGILRSLPAGLMTVDSQGSIQYANESALSILHVPSTDLVERQLTQAVPTMGVRWRQFSWENSGSISPLGGRDRFEGTHRLPNGQLIRIGFSLAPLSLKEGQWSGVVVVFQDVTHVKMLREAVQRAERLATVGKFAAGLAHEVRNPLASMCASIDVLSASMSPPENLQRLMNNVTKEADRLNMLISDFLSFAKPRQLELKEAQLTSIVQGVVEMFENEPAAAPLTVETSFSQELVAMIDEALIRQVLWNLVRNAAESMADRPGTLRVETLEVAGEAIVRVIDQGCGLAEDQLDRVADPFYTTKSGGSGLGLAVVHSIVEAHGGRVIINSEVGKGTAVSVHLMQRLPTSDLEISAAIVAVGVEQESLKP